MKTICGRKGYVFNHWTIVPNLTDIMEEKRDGIHTLLIFEDVSYSMDDRPKSFVNIFKDFLVNSRHHDISICYIIHSIKNAMAKSTSIDRFYLENASVFVVFRVYDNKYSVYKYLQRFFVYDKYFPRTLDAMFSSLTEYTKYPYILIQPRKIDVKDDFCKIRSCLFDVHKNFIFVSGYNAM